MLSLDIASRRLYNQLISRQPFEQPGQVVAWLGAVQAQDYLGALWAIGLRLPQATEADIEQAMAARTIVRTWPMRGTIHFVATADVRWMLALLTPRIIAQSAGRYRQLDLDEALFARSKELFIQALQGGRQLTRDELYQRLEQARIAPGGQRGYHLLCRSAQDGLICFGSPRGKQQTFTLLDEWLPPAKNLERDEALAELARRYFTGHGPATLPDFARWSGLTVTEARAGLDMVNSHLSQATVKGQTYWLSPDEPASADDSGLSRISGDLTGTLRENLSGLLPKNWDSAAAYLLPGFDEYLLGYKDRTAVLEAIHAPKIIPGNNGIFSPTLVIDGQVAGTWKRTFKKDTVIFETSPFTPLTEAQKQAIVAAAQRYGRFVGKSLTVTG